MTLRERMDGLIGIADASYTAGEPSPFAGAMKARERVQDNQNEFLRLTASKDIAELGINRDAANLSRLAIQIDCALRELGHAGIHSLPEIKDVAE